MKKAFKLIGLGATLVAAGVGIAYMLVITRQYENTDNAYIKVDQVVLSPKVGGYVVAVAVQDNQKVKAGDVLVRIDPIDFETRIAQERATLASREAALEAMIRRNSLNQAEITQARYALEAASAQAAKAVSDHQRDRRLLKDGYATVYQAEVSQLNERVATSSKSRTRAQLDASHHQTSLLDAQAEQLRAEIQQAQAALKLLQLDLKNTTLLAPVDGVIGNKTVELGQFVRAGSQLLTLVSDQRAYVVANFKETQMTSLKIRQPVLVKVDAYPDLKLTGRVESIAPATGAEFSLLPPENATGNFTKIVQRVPVRIVLDNTKTIGLNAVLRSGLSVNVRVDTRAPLAGSPEANVAGMSPAASATH
jgi:membrane fusion protein, multidrug efflux system